MANVKTTGYVLSICAVLSTGMYSMDINKKNSSAQLKKSKRCFDFAEIYNAALQKPVEQPRPQSLKIATPMPRKDLGIERSGLTMLILESEGYYKDMP